MRPPKSSIRQRCQFMEEMQRKVLLVAEDPDLAEIAAIGLRLAHGWEPVIATDLTEAIEQAQTPAMTALVYIAVRPSSQRFNLRTLCALCEMLKIPLLTVTPDEALAEQFRCMGMRVICTPFDPLTMWHGVSMPTPRAERLTH